LRPLTEHVPKAVLPMLDVPLGAFGLKELGKVSSRLIVNVDARAATEIQSILEPMAEKEGVSFVHESPEPFGAAGTLAAIRAEVEDIVLTWNADCITDLAVDGLLEAHEASGAAATIAVAPVDSSADVTYDRWRATAFINRHERPDAGGGRFIGVAVFGKQVLEALPEQRPLGLAETVLEPLVAQGELAVLEHTGYAMDVGTFPRYLRASLDLLEGRGPPHPIPWPGKMLALETGNAYLGPGAHAAEGSLGPGAILLRGAGAGKGAYIENSIVWRDSMAPEGEVVSGSVWPWFRASAP
jgi:mannose-1-phosphate guanylyltransferase